MFSSSHDGTIPLLYADLFVSRVLCVPLFHSFVLCVRVCRSSPLNHLTSATIVQTNAFHSIGTRAVSPTSTIQHSIPNRWRPLYGSQVKALTAPSLIKSRAIRHERNRQPRTLFVSKATIRAGLVCMKCLTCRIQTQSLSVLG